MGYHPAVRVLEQLQKSVKKVLPIKDTISRSRNGAVVFIPPLQRLHIYYDHPRMGAGGTSKGMVEWLHTKLIPFAKSHPHIEIAIQPRGQQPPEVVGSYGTGHQKKMWVAKLDRDEIHRKILYLANTAGGVDRTYTTPVLRARGEGVDPVWNPFQAEKTFHP
ncbi:hypothetical protein SmJEL517_g05097 [Synchytrium microbalum]|uniref:Large ribosomal subunit protein mL43 n=1 Tax=Synchytrium microbalum TaxID=1806994 RepID=A0A507BWQ6_9FUNG|nr:uncharacterized protein SmJEL517_g05097 [Synchytrium microbalum]TPX31588.1 hypothetical protein SmJEL517_g05097 [Synchytrium microbalum]